MTASLHSAIGPTEFHYRAAYHGYLKVIVVWVSVSARIYSACFFNVMPSENVIQVAKGEESLYRLI